MFDHLFVAEEWPALAAFLKTLTDEDPGYYVPPMYSNGEGLPPKICFLQFNEQSSDFLQDIKAKLSAQYPSTSFLIKNRKESV